LGERTSFWVQFTPEEEEGRDWAVGSAGPGGKVGQARRRGGPRERKEKRKMKKEN
jgi:hypothetical protein